jgi:hypothetical protein
MADAETGLPEAAGAGRRRVRAAPVRTTRPKRRSRRAKPVRWSAKREEIFLATLGETANVAASIRASGLSETSVYRRRRKSEEFRARWATALREGYANYSEANRALWRLTIVPLAGKIAGGIAAALNAWWPDLVLKLDLDGVPALASDRQALWAQVAGADFLSVDEKRAMLGFGPQGETGAG